MSEIRGTFGGYWHGEDVVALVIHPDPTSYDPETAMEPPFPFGSTVVLRAAPSPVTAAGEEPVLDGIARPFLREVAIARSWRFTQAGAEGTIGWQEGEEVWAAKLVLGEKLSSIGPSGPLWRVCRKRPSYSCHPGNCDCTDAAAPSPTSAVAPGLREWVEEQREKARDEASKQHPMAPVTSWYYKLEGEMRAYDAVLAEIDRRAAGEVEP